MKCGDCVYYECDVCYRRGAKVSANNNICEYYITMVNYQGKNINDNYNSFEG